MKNNFHLYLIAIIASFSGLLAGFDTGVISGALLYINQSFPSNPATTGLLVSSVSIGAIIGAITNGVLVDKIGRKNTLLLSATIFFFGSVFCAVSNNIGQLIISRTFIGCAVGIVSFVGPLYLSEISTKEKRGAIVSFYQIAITFGILFSYLINYLFSSFELNWRIMLCLGALPAIVLFFGMLFQLDTPRWYVLKNKFDFSKKALLKLNFKGNIENEIENIKSTLTNKENIKFNKKFALPFIVGIGIMFVQIATGINVIIYYAPTIFKSLGFSSDQDTLFMTIIIGLINFLMTFVAFILVDKLGRKPLLYIGLGGMCISLFAIANIFVLNYAFIKYIAILFCGLYIVSFSISLGPIALLLISEIFPLKYRGQAMSISILANFIFNFFTTGLFPIALANFGGYITFSFFALICIVSIVFVYFVVPETKGLSLEEIEKNWNRNKIIS